MAGLLRLVDAWKEVLRAFTFLRVTWFNLGLFYLYRLLLSVETYRWWYVYPPLAHFLH